MSPHSDAAFFAQLSRELMERNETLTLEHVAQGAVDAVPAVDASGVSLRKRRHRVESGAATAPVAGVCDALQYELGEGPCVEAIWEAESFLCQDTSADPRWPRWGPRAAQEGVGSVLSVRLATSAETLGAINMYAHRTRAFSQDDVDRGLIYAVHATNAMNIARLVNGLQTAVHSRHLIGVAQGILMSRYGLALDHAFEVLRRYSSHKNVKLRDLAGEVIERGGLPDVDLRGLPLPALRPNTRR